MKNIKVTIPKGMTPSDADDILYKAIDSKINGSKSEKFEDKLTEDLANSLIKYHEDLYNELILDIIKILESK